MATDFAWYSVSNSYGTYYYILSYDLLSQSIGGNYSTIRVYGRLQLPVYSSWSRGSIDINGVSFGLGTYYSAGTHNIGSTDITVYHNNDGTGSVYVSGSISTSYLMNGSCGGTVYLPQIARYSVMSTAPNFNDEENPTITFTNPSNGYFSLRAKIEAGGNTQLITRDLSNTATSCTFNLTQAERETLRNLIPNSNSLPVRFTICAMSGNTELNASYLDRTMTIVNGNPVFSDFEFEDLNSDTVSLTGNDQVIVKGYSNIGIRIPVLNKAEAVKGATMSKYRIVVGDYTEDLTYSDSAMVSSSTILKVTTGTMNVYAIDSRNNSTLVTKLATREIDYTPATVDSSSKIERNDSGVGTSGILTYSGTYWNDDFGDEVNAIESVSYEFKPTSSSTWVTGTTDITPTISNSNFSFTGIVRSNASDYSFDIATSYDFRITITDKLTTIVYVFTPLASGTPNLALSENGTAIGMSYDESEGGSIQLINDIKLYDRATDTWIPLSGVGGGSLPIGTILEYPTSDSTKIPNGYLVCDGSEVSRTEYPELFDIIGTSYGGGNGTTTFNLPNLKGRVAVGYNSSDTDFNSIGKTGGSKELQQHYHTYVIPGNVNPTSHSYTSDSFQYYGWGSSFHDSFMDTQKAGTGNSGNLQPYVVVNYIIKAKGSSTPAPTTSEVVTNYTESDTDTYSCNYINNNYRPTTLYSSSSGTTGNITLSDSVANYSSIEVYFHTNDGAGFRGCQKVHTSSGTTVASLIFIHPASSNYYIKVKEISVTGTQLTVAGSKEIYSGGSSNSNYIYIDKVLGYK